MPDVVDDAPESAQTSPMTTLRRLALIGLLMAGAAAACPEPEGGDDDSATDDDDSAAADDDDVWDDDDVTELPPVEDVSGLVDGYWLLDLIEADYVEPPNMRILLAASIGDLKLLFGVDPTSDLEAGEVHILGALGDDATEPVEQDLCRHTQPFTAGSDGRFGTDDDRVGEFANPAVRLSSFDYDLVASNTIVPLTDVSLTFGFTPDGQGIERGRLRATMDTRPIALDILGNEDPYAGCALIFEASKRECFECGGENPGNFCIGLEIANLPGTRQGDGLVERRCEEIIREDVEDTGCDGRAEDFQREGEEGWPLCPAYEGKR